MLAAVPQLEPALAARFSGFQYRRWLVDSFLKISLPNNSLPE
jgi:hypothetical protein